MTTELRPAAPTPARPGGDRAASPPGDHRWWRPATAPHLVLAALFLAGYTLLAVLRYHRFGSPSWDLGIFTEAVKAYAHGRAPIVPIKGEGYDILGDHWSPVLVLLAPAFRLFPSPLTLLVAQAALLAWSAGVVSDTAARLLGRARGLCVGVAYGLSFGIQRAVDVEFHEIAFAVPLLAVVCRQLLLRRWARAGWWALPLLLVKEDQGLTVAAVGVLIALLGRRRTAGTALLVGGAAAVAVAIGWLIPHFNPGHHFEYWSKLPGGTSPQWWQILVRPVERLQTWKTLGWTFGVAGLIALRSPLALLAAPTLAWRFVSGSPIYWGPDWHYSATLMPVVFLALADAAARATASRRLWYRTLADRIVTAVPAVAVACMVSLPVGLGDLARADAWTAGPVGRARLAALRLVPDGVRVESSSAMLARLAARTDAYWPGGELAAPPDYLVLDADDWPDAPTDDQVTAQQSHSHHAPYELIFRQEGVMVLRLIH